MNPAGEPNPLYPAALSDASVRFLSSATPGTRVVARYRVEGGLTDALGVLLGCDDKACVIETKRGPVTVPLAEVVAAKQVPPPPRRRSGGSVDAEPDQRPGAG